MEGLPTGLSKNISALFPNKLVKSKIGRIPERWEVKTIADLAECVGGATPSTRNPDFWNDGDVSWATPRDLSQCRSAHLMATRRKISEPGLAKIASGLLPAGTVLLSSRAPVGYLALATEPMAVNQGLIALKPKEGVSNFYLLNWCLSNLERIKNRSSGTTFPEINKRSFKPMSALVPSQATMENYHEMVSPMYERMLISNKDISILTELRDSLLPKLISSELQISDAEKFLESVGA